VGPALHISSWRVYGLMDEVMVLSSKSNLVFVPITKNISTKMAVESLTPLYPSSLRVLTLYLSLFWCFVFLGKLKKCEVDVNVIPRYPSLVFVWNFFSCHTEAALMAKSCGTLFLATRFCLSLLCVDLKNLPVERCVNRPKI